MAKQVFDIGSVFSATMAAVQKGNDAAAVATVATSAMRGRSLVDCVALYVGAMQSEEAVKGGKAGAVARAVELLDSKGVDITSTKDVRDALWPAVWAQAGGTGKPTKGEEGDEVAARFYNTAYVRVKRMADSITGVVAADKAAVRVPREVMALAEQLVAWDARVVAEALKRARKAARKAKAE